MENGKIAFGWRWSRKEIENYLIDPTVVSRSLGTTAPSPVDYLRLLEVAADKICFYQTARTALGNCRRRFSDLPSNWGRRRGRDDHPFPDDVTDMGCKAGIGQVVTDHGVEQTITSAEVLARYNDLLPTFIASGPRRLDFMWTFAGKDLLVSMEKDLTSYGFASVAVFCERVLLGIERTADDIGAWLPEWAALRSAVQSF